MFDSAVTGDCHFDDKRHRHQQVDTDSLLPASRSQRQQEDEEKGQRSASFQYRHRMDFRACILFQHSVIGWIYAIFQ